MNHRVELRAWHLPGALLFLLIGFFLLKLPQFYLLIDNYCVFLAKICHVLLSLFSEQIYLQGNVLRYTENGSGVTIDKACSGLDFMLVACSAVIVFGANISFRFVWLLLVVAGIFALNLLRLLILFMTNVFTSDYFQFVHETVGPFVLITCTSLILMISFELYEKSRSKTQLETSTKSIVLRGFGFLLSFLVIFAFYLLLIELGVISIWVKWNGLILEAVYHSHQLAVYEISEKGWHIQSAFFAAGAPYASGENSSAINASSSLLDLGNLDVYGLGIATYLLLQTFQFLVLGKRTRVNQFVKDLLIILFITVLSIGIKMVFSYLDMMDIEQGYPRVLSDASTIIIPNTLSGPLLSLLKALNDMAAYGVVVILPLFFSVTSSGRVKSCDLRLAKTPQVRHG